MRRFHYTARRDPQSLHEGTVEAESTEAAVRALTARGLYPIEVEAVDSNTGGPGRQGLMAFLKRPLGRRRLRLADQALLARQLGELLEAGVALLPCLTLLREQSGSSLLGSLLADLETRVRGGDALSAALEAQEGIFPSTFIGLVRAGEASGRLGPILLGLADLIEEDERLIQKVREALRYPLIVVAASILTLAVLFTYLLPRLKVLYDDLGQALPIPTRILLGLASGAQALWPLWLALLALIGLGILRRGQLPFLARGASDQLLLKMPVIGSVLHHRELVRFARSLATLLRSSVPAMDALRLTADSTANRAFAAQVLQIRSGVHEGAPISDGMRAAPLLSGPIATMVHVGEQGGDPANSLDRAARFYERLLDADLKRLTTWLEPLLIGALGLVVALIVAAMLLPILEIDLTGG